jgi:hypothetical protein
LGPDESWVWRGLLAEDVYDGHAFPLQEEVGGKLRFAGIFTEGDDLLDYGEVDTGARLIADNVTLAEYSATNEPATTFRLTWLDEPPATISPKTPTTRHRY